VRVASFAVFMASGLACAPDREPSPRAAPEDAPDPLVNDEPSGALEDPSTSAGDPGSGSEESTSHPDTAPQQPEPGTDTVAWQRVTEGLDGLMTRPSAFDTAPLDGAHGLSGVAYGNGVWVVLGEEQGDDGMIRWATSTDGVTWSSASQALPSGLAAVTSRLLFVQGEFVLFDARSTSSGDKDLYIYTSSDAVSWRARQVLRGASAGFDIASNGQHLVGAFGLGQIWNSSDLGGWSARALDRFEGNAGVVDVAFGGERWVASVALSRNVDGRYQGEGRSYTSNDGQTWERSGLSGNENFQVEYGNGVWVALNALHEYRTSVDGVNFDTAEPLGLWRHAQQYPWLRFAGGRFLSSHVDLDQSPPSEIQLLSSEDGVSWSDFGALPGITLPEGAINVEYHIRDVAYADCRYVVAGTYAIQVPGALDSPPFAREVGPLLLTANVCESAR